VLPGPGLSLFVQLADNTAHYRRMGPFSGGLVLRRLLVVPMVVSASPTITTLTIGASLGHKRSANQAGLDAGFPLVGASDVVEGRTPVLAFPALDAQSVFMSIPIGISVESGANWLVLFARQTDPDATAGVLFGVETVLAGARLGRVDVGGVPPALGV